MNSPVQHRLQIGSPDGFKEFRFRPDLLERVFFIEGRKGTGKWSLLGIRFNAHEWTPEDARGWLSLHGFDPEKMEPAAPTDPPVSSWQKVVIDIAKEGPIVDMNGNEHDLTLEGHLLPMVNGFAEEQARGADLPEIKYDHDDGVGAIGIGHLTALLWDPEKRWMTASGLVHDEAAAHNIRRGHGRVSLEAGPDDAYGEGLYPWVLSALAVLPPGTKPAVPGAGATIAAGKKKERIMFLREMSLNHAPDTGGGDGKEPTVKDLEAQIVDLSKTLRDLTERLGGIETKLEKMSEKPAGDPPADEKTAQAVADLSKRIEGLEGQISEQEIKATLDSYQTPENFVLTKGGREKIEGQLKEAKTPAEKRAVLATVALLGKSLPSGDRTLDQDDTTNKIAAQKKREDHVKEIMETQKVDRTRALSISSQTRPDLWSDENS